MASITPEVLGYVGSIPITNSIVNTLFVDAVIVGGVFFLKRNFQKIPRLFQNIIELIIDTFYRFIESVSSKHVQKIFPFVMTFFLYILIANWSGLIPGVTSIGFFHQGEHGRELIPIMRNATSDLNVTFALAIISLVTTHIFSIQSIGIKEYISRFVSFNPIYLFVGILELISEITKILSLSFRLFGNIFAGEVVLLTISSLLAFIAPIPFLLLEILVGLVQALVFSILTMAFMTMLMTPHHEEKQHAKEVNR
ncbi:MAG: F0F1 ATP synthase subunit A [Candidatus Levybacteria bacterium]|nr:F0F1 ATP synthase subunit A [Candidatus Levybacteria bacterium]